MTAYGDNPEHHAIKDGRFVCTAPKDAPCRTSPTCACEQWCSCDGSLEDAKDNHDDGHCCMLTAVAGQECWLVPWVDAAGLEESYGPQDRTDFPDGPVTCDWDESVYWEYAEAGDPS